MTTRFAWLVPAFYQIPSDIALCFDTTACTKNLLTNKVWERKFEYSFISSLEKLLTLSSESRTSKGIQRTALCARKIVAILKAGISSIVCSIYWYGAAETLIVSPC
jgi:hypothetical protein